MQAVLDITTKRVHSMSFITKLVDLPGGTRDIQVPVVFVTLSTE